MDSQCNPISSLPMGVDVELKKTDIPKEVRFDF